MLLDILPSSANMGVCFSAQVKTEHPYNTELNSNNKVSAVSVPQTAQGEGEILPSSTLKRYTYAELCTATGNFRPDSVLGEGSFGAVFKGWIDENSLAAAKPGTGIVIAIKSLNQDGRQGYRKWLAEVNYLGRFSHPHLVRLIGYCLEDEHRLLVYEFMPRGSLENHLFRRGSYFQPLSWSLRLKVALDAAKGLAFLHSAENKVIYRDFKTSNVLLDSDYNAKLSDFGLARDGPTGDKSHIFTNTLVGNIGYAAPEYVDSGLLTTKSDVYSFGVVLLEMVCGRRVIDKNKPYGEHNLVQWAKPYLNTKRKVLRVLDSRLEGQCSAVEAYKVTSLALKCLSEKSSRPNMDEVVSTLEQLAHKLQRLNSNNKVSAVSVPQTAQTEGEILQSSNLKSYTYAELRTATRNFQPDSVLGEGGFGTVFKGWIDENSLAAAKPDTGTVIAIKKLHQDGLQGHREWLAEVNYLGRFSHPHLVRLIGYCLEAGHRLLVYEFMPRGNLENHLFRRGSHFQPLSWSIRLKVALAAAKGLAFLHSTEAKVIHRDFKTSNILLDSDYNAKLSDFGLARDGPSDDKSHVSTRIMGTDGYADPEYVESGHLTTKSDVYSFGVVLLEMVCGRRVIDRNAPPAQRNLIEWAKPYVSNKRKALKVLDSKLEGQCSADEAYKVAALALRCLSEKSSRPNMDEVVCTLEQLIHNQLGRTDCPAARLPCMICW